MDDKLQKLEDAAKDYINKEKKRLNSEHDFLDAILQAHGYSKLEDHNNSKAGDLLVKSILDFLGS